MENYCLISLGCAKNLVDSEIIAGKMKESGFQKAALKDARIAILNTCAFIQEAKVESLQNILRLEKWKSDRKGRILLVCGCLPERYRDELAKSLPSVDIWAGVNDILRIPEILKSFLENKAVSSFDSRLLSYDDELSREISTPTHWAYLKIAEGCNHRCTFCVIPAIRGKFRSRSRSSVLNEARKLALQGVKEINLIAQDTTAYGKDFNGKSELPELLESLCEVSGIEWIRLLYSHPESIEDKLLDVISREKKICKYLDIPMQHSRTRILKRMGRGGNEKYYLDLINKIRDKIPDVTLRSSFIVGFPGEDEDDFLHLLKFIEKVEFDRVGAFMYSREEGTPAYFFTPQVHHSTSRRRYETLMKAQQEISKRKNISLIGRKILAIIEGKTARSHRDAPEVDGNINIISGKAEIGEIVTVKITGADYYDLEGEIIN